MTREEIEGAHPDHLQALICITLGWVRNEHPSGWIRRDHPGDYPWTSPNGQGAMRLPDWDYTDTMMLERHMPHFKLERLQPKSWQCQSRHCGNPLDHDMGNCGCIIGEGTIAAVAIERAYLLLKLYEQEQPQLRESKS